MPCLLAMIGFFFPRVALVILWLTGYTSNAFQTTLWPFLGFLFMPFTTLAYAYAMNTNGSVTGFYLFLVIVGVMMDVGVLGGGGHARRRRMQQQS
jgi:hypothetical protein